MSNTNNYNKIKNLCSDFYSEMDKLVTQVLSEFKVNHDEYYDDLKKHLFGNSKQIRSCLIFLFAQNLGFKSTDTDIIKLAAAVEIIHNATLIHDDIIDESSIRRGNIALHSKYSNKLGVISGDFLLSVALNLLLELPSEVMKNFGICLNNLCLGELNQYFSIKTTPTINEYLKKSEQKTASLFVAGLKSLFEIKSPKLKPQAELFALHFGRAFQIKDDLKNILSTDENKPVLNDINQGIYTPAVIFAFGEKQDLSDLDTDEIIIKSNSSQPIEQTLNLLNSEIKEAIYQLEEFPPDVYKFSILELCNQLTLETK